MIKESWKGGKEGKAKDHRKHWEWKLVEGKAGGAFFPQVQAWEEDNQLLSRKQTTLFSMTAQKMCWPYSWEKIKVRLCDDQSCQNYILLFLRMGKISRSVDELFNNWMQFWALGWEYGSKHSTFIKLAFCRCVGFQFYDWQSVWSKAIQTKW